MQTDNGRKTNKKSDKKEKLKEVLMAFAFLAFSGFSIVVTIIEKGGIANFLSELFVGILLLIGCYIVLYFIVNHK